MWDNATLLRNTANTLFLFSVFAMLFGIALYAMRLPGLLPLRSVRLSAAPQRVSAAGLLQVVRSEVRGNLFTVDIERLRRSLEKLPWVRSVSIRREFPDHLVLQLEEHQALARWNNNALVNQYGETFVAESEQVLPGFIGQDGTSAEIAQHYGLFNQRLAGLGLSVAQVALSQRHAWQLHLNNGMVLELGREDVQQRLARFAVIYPNAQGISGDLASVACQPGRMAGCSARSGNSGGGNTVKYVDLRYRNGFAVRQVTKGRERGADRWTVS